MGLKLPRGHLHSQCYHVLRGCKKIKNRKPNLASERLSACGRGFTQPIAYNFTHLSSQYTVCLNNSRPVAIVFPISRSNVTNNGHTTTRNYVVLWWHRLLVFHCFTRKLSMRRKQNQNEVNFRKPLSAESVYKGRNSNFRELPTCNLINIW